MKGKLIAIFVSLAMLSGAGYVIALDSNPVVQSGNGNVTVINAAPSIPSIGVNDTANWVASVDVNAELMFYVNVSDANTIDHIKNVTLDIYPPGFTNYDGATYHYKFRYVETNTMDGVLAGTWTQLYPTSGPTYITPADCDVPASPLANTGSYVFDFTLNKTAISTGWIIYAKVNDASATSAEKFGAFNVYKYVEMTYVATSGNDFAWANVATGTANVNSPFTVTVTSNTPYTLAAAYNNSFYNGTVDWGSEPSLEVSQTLTVPVTNVSASYADWYTSAAGGYQVVTNHKMYLDIPAVLPVLSYSGVTIYIQARV